MSQGCHLAARCAPRLPGTVAVMGPSPRHLAGAALAHRKLLAALDTLTDELVGQPSLLSGWTIGHVLAHIARNADSHVRLLEGAARGEVVTQYEGGVESRGTDIEAGAPRSADEHRRDVQQSSSRLERVWADASEATWAGRGIGAFGDEIPCVDLVFRRWRETTVHHTDLGHVDRGLGLPPTSWAADYVREDLQRLTATWAARRPMGLTTLPPEALAVDDRGRLAWLLGRAEIAGLPPAGIL
jgi:maleylpyruvate isomerase